jgi:hypothetical protein
VADRFTGRSAHAAPDEADQHRARDASGVSIASAVAEAVRNVPGVTGLSPGHSALAATFGPTGTVIGVVLYRQSRTPNDGGDEKNTKAEAIPFPGETRIEVHVTVDATAALSSPQKVEPEIAATGPDKTAPDRTLDEHIAVGFLPAVATQIRRAVQTTAQTMGLPAEITVDVFIDDLD